MDAAIALADAEGMAALSMRAVGERLGRTAMALYTYVPSKSELVDLMYDRALAELPSGYDPGQGWRAAVTSWAGEPGGSICATRGCCRCRRPGRCSAPTNTPPWRRLLRVLRETLLPAGVLRRAVGTLFYFVRGSAQATAETRQAAAATGVSDEEWWFARSALISEMAPDFGERYPALTWLDSEGAFLEKGDETIPYMEREATRTFEAGLAVLLDGVEAATRRAPAEPPGGTAPAARPVPS